MSITASWPDSQTLIPDALAAGPQVRAVFDLYGLHGCGGPNAPRESLDFFARAHEVPIERQGVGVLRLLRFLCAGLVHCAGGLREPVPDALWGAHLWLVMAGRARRRSLASDSPKTAALAPGDEILAGHTVGEVLDQHPHLLEPFVAFGFTMLTNPRMRKTIARVVAIERACRRTGVDSGELLVALNRRARSEMAGAAPTRRPDHPASLAVSPRSVTILSRGATP